MYLFDSTEQVNVKWGVQRDRENRTLTVWDMVRYAVVNFIDSIRKHYCDPAAHESFNAGLNFGLLAALLTYTN